MLCNGQDGAVNLDRYPFVNYDINDVQFFKDSLDFYGFFRKLDKLVTTGKGKINIVHFGGSHVQADMWTGQLRDNFNEFLNQKQAARGWIYPFKLGFKSNNNPSNYAFDWTGRWDGCRAVNAFCTGNIGLNAITTTTHDSGATFTVIMKQEGKTDYVFDRIKVFYDNHHQSFQVALDSPFVAKQVIDNKDAGYREFIFAEPMRQVTFKCLKTDSLQNIFTLFGLFCDLDAPGINYNAIGANGASVPTYLKCNFLEREIAELKPDLIIFSVGINDAFAPDFCQSCYERNYEEWIKRIKKVAPNAAILFTTNTDSYKKNKRGKFYQNITGLEVKSAMRNLATKYNAGVWDLFSIMGGLGSMEFWARNGMASNRDRVHMSLRGYRLMGDMMFVALIRKYEEYLKLPISKIKHD
jgi:lysophospholipase L1-like esterase